jgi:NADH-quinone oxidoreductase subunit N
MQMIDLYYLSPLLTVVIGAIVLMLMSPLKGLSIRGFAKVALLFLVIAFALQVSSLGEYYSHQIAVEYIGNMLIADSFSALFNTILILGAIGTILVGLHYFEVHDFFKAEVFSVLLFSLFGMMLLVSANELITAFVALEIASISLYIMIGFDRKSNKRVEGIFKYLVLGSFASAIYLFGVAFVYAQTSTTSLIAIYDYVLTHLNQDISLLIIGATLMLLTFLFKMAAFPFHGWAIDVYDAAPYPITGYMASTFKLAIFAIVFRIYLVDLGLIIDIWDQFFYVIIIFTLIAGTLLAVVQTSIKRMLAASSIVHTGYILIAFVSTGVLEDVQMGASIIFYLIAYFLSAIGAFGLVSYLSSNEKLRVQYDDFKGFASERPYMAVMMTIFLLSLAGIPSTIGFIGKFYVFIGAIEAQHTILAILGIIATVVSIYYYFRIIANIYFYPSSAMKNIPTLHGVSPYVIGIISLVIMWGGISGVDLQLLPSVDTLIKITEISYESLFIPFQ